MADIVLSAAIRSNLLSLQNTAAALDQTQTRLSTGNKVNSAIDNPTSYFTAQGLNNRASDLSTLLDNEGLAVQTLQAASQGIDAITKLVSQAKSTANQALQATVTATTLTTAVTTKNLSGASKTLIVQVGSAAAKTVTLSSATESAGAAKLAISAAGITGLSVVASSGNLTFTVASGQKLTLSGTATGSGNSFAGTLTSSNGTNRDSYVKSYNDLLTQIDQLSGDASFNGVNLLQSGTSLSVNFNEKQTSKLNISGVKLNSSGLGLSTLSTSTDWKSAGAINSTISSLDTATNTLRSQSSTFGGNLSVVQNRQDFTKNLINTLQTGAAGLTLADTNTEGANLLALQTRQQLSITALSLANQSQQAILKVL
jgi:flagellin-like hook-associated protein FlgL